MLKFESLNIVDLNHYFFLLSNMIFFKIDPVILE